MNELLTATSLFAIVLTLGAYEFGIWLQKKLKSPICNLILIAVILVIAAIKILDVAPRDYAAGCETFSWLLTPATVCLAVPLYEQVKVLKKNLPAIFVGVLAGTAVSLGCVAILCRVLPWRTECWPPFCPRALPRPWASPSASSWGACLR